MVSTLRIVHAPSSDNPTLLPLLVLYVDAKRYMFNLPEGSTRAMAQRGIRGLVRGCGNVFVASIGTESGGAPGMIMTLADMGRNKLTLHGPSPLAHFVTTMRTYARRDELELQVNEVQTAAAPKSPLFKDDSVTVHAVMLTPDTAPEQDGNAHKRRRLSPSVTSPRSKSPPSNSSSNGETAAQLVRSLFPGSLTAQKRDPFKPLPPLAAHDLPFDGAPAKALCFIVEHPAQRGKFVNERANDLGVPLGKARGLLIKQGSWKILRPTAWPSWDAKRKLDWLKAEERRIKTEEKKQEAETKKRKKGSKESEGDTGKAAKAGKEAVQPQLPPVEEHEEVIVTAAQVTGEAKPGSLFIQLYVPSLAFLPSLLEESGQARFAPHFAGAEGLTPHLIIHAAPTEVLTDSRYLDFIKRFGPAAHHIISNADFTTDKLAYPSAALAQLRLAQLDSDIWRPHRYSLSPKLSLEQLGLPNASAAGLDVEVPLLPPAPPFARSGDAPDFHARLDSEATRDALSYVGVGAGAKLNAATIQAGREAGWRQFVALADELRPAVAAAEREETRGEAPELVITALGTGSAAPSKYRNVSGTLIHVPGGNYMLLDAGESTYAQLKRRFGDGSAHPYEEASRAAEWEPKGGVDEVLRNLRVLFLSHIHGDHHMGVSKILAERKKLKPTQPLYVITTVFIRNYLTEYDAIAPLGLADAQLGPDAKHGDVIFLDSEALDFESGVDAHELSADGKAMQPVSPKSQDARQLAKLKAFAARKAETAHVAAAQRLREAMPAEEGATLAEARDDSDVQAKKLLARRSSTRQYVRRHLARCKASLGLERIATCEVDHRATHCYGLVAWSKPGGGEGKPWSVAYSGDTRPCATLVRAGKGVDVLIHEATIEDTEPEMAHAKGHSTFGQAIAVAREMQAKHCFLTHFSQRYPKLPRLSVGMETEGDGGEEERKMPVAMAFDLLSMHVKDMWKMERYRPAMELLFDADEDDGVADASEADEVVQNKADAVEGQQADVEMAAAEMVGVAADGPLAAPRTADAQIATVNGNGAAAADTERVNIERNNVKGSEYAYIILELTLPREQAAPAPSAAVLHEACRQSVVRMHGLVGGAFVFDVLHVQQSNAGQGAEALLRVASEHLPFLSSSLAADLRLPVAGATASGGSVVHWRTSIRATSGASGLAHAALSDSRAWLEEVIKRETQ